MEVRYASKLATAMVCLASLAATTPAWASNPWGRAVGEAHALHHVTEDLRNRVHRLFPHSPATPLTRVLDEMACQLRDMVKCGAEWGRLRSGLGAFQDLQRHVDRAIAVDCNLSQDRAIARYLRMIDDRYDDLVHDLSKCKPWIPGPPVPSFIDPRYLVPPVTPDRPRYWQGSLPRNSFDPRSTSYSYSTSDFEGLSSRTDDRPSDVRGASLAARPTHADIVGLLLWQVLR